MFYVTDTLTLSVRDCDEVRGYLVKHYKIQTEHFSKFPTMYYIAQSRSFPSVQELVDHYRGKGL